MDITQTPESAPVSQTPATVNVTPQQDVISGNFDWGSVVKNPELSNYVQAKGFKDPENIVDAYRGLEKLVGVPKERLLKLPEASDAPEWKDIFQKLGTPKSKDEYSFQLPKEHDPVLVENARQIFHEAGLTQKQAEKVLEKYLGMNEEVIKQVTAKNEFELAQKKEALQSEWGAAYDQNINIARQAVTKFGIETKALDALENALGFDGVMKFMHKLGAGVGESQLVSTSSNSGFGINTPAQAREQIAQLGKDRAFISRLSNGDRDATALWNKLNKEASV